MNFNFREAEEGKSTRGNLVRRRTTKKQVRTPPHCVITRYSTSCVGDF